MTLPTLRPNGETVSEVGRPGHTHTAPKRMAAVRLALAMTARGQEAAPTRWRQDHHRSRGSRDQEQRGLEEPKVHMKSRLPHGRQALQELLTFSQRKGTKTSWVNNTLRETRTTEFLNHF